jgi:hypothetical protein
MQETFTVTKDQVLEAFDASNHTWKIKIKEWFPEAFKTELIIGNWYKTHINSSGGFLLFIWSGNYGNYTQKGFDINGDWKDKLGFHEYDTVEDADEDEVVVALTEEYKKRGFNKGAKFKCLSAPTETYTVTVENPIFWNLDDPKVENDPNKYNISGTKTPGGVIFRKGEWAKLVSPVVEDSSASMKEEEVPPTQEEIQRVLKHLISERVSKQN